MKSSTVEEDKSSAKRGGNRPSKKAHYSSSCRRQEACRSAVNRSIIGSSASLLGLCHGSGGLRLIKSIGPCFELSDRDGYRFAVVTQTRGKGARRSKQHYTGCPDKAACRRVRRRLKLKWMAAFQKELTQDDGWVAELAKRTKEAGDRWREAWSKKGSDAAGAARDTTLTEEDDGERVEDGQGNAGRKRKRGSRPAQEGCAWACPRCLGLRIYPPPTRKVVPNSHFKVAFARGGL